ncbi:hypothetical protein C4D60_Mb08t00170 [Musa balbisiana]|uniref:Cytochrome P450 90A1 n=1 Tax=Musa balbisiana TaxID=52838 RepID=A0A4S8K071_MUSBA|nr:hypothetical protein C4D60_Mb08t00170 [Musa balbisiana]
MALGVWSPSLIDVVLFVIAAVVVWKLERRRRRRRRGWATGRLPPGSEGLPVVGETLQLIAAYKSENPEPFIDERVRRHGRLFTTHVFGERTVFSADPEFNRMVLGAEDRTVEGSYPSSLSTLLGTHSLVVMKGARHKRMHSLTLARLTSPAAIREAKLLLHIDRLVRRTLDSWPSSSLVLLLDEAKKITFELTVKQLVINETLRVVNIIGGVFRRAKTDLHFKGYTIPKGCKVFLSFRAVHLDTEYFDDARTFNPWRWQKNAAAQQVGGATVYTPFGGGSRLCPGYELARVVISVFLHYLVTRFNWEEAEKDRLVFFPTTRTLKSYPINVWRREEEEDA